MRPPVVVRKRLQRIFRLTAGGARGVPQTAHKILRVHALVARWQFRQRFQTQLALREKVFQRPQPLLVAALRLGLEIDPQRQRPVDRFARRRPIPALV